MRAIHRGQLYNLHVRPRYSGKREFLILPSIRFPPVPLVRCLWPFCRKNGKFIEKYRWRMPHTSVLTTGVTPWVAEYTIQFNIRAFNALLMCGTHNIRYSCMLY